MRFIFTLLALLGTAMLSGCATYGAGVETALVQVKQGHYQAAETDFKKALNPEGNDRLLYFLELATVKTLAQEYQTSNDLLEQAERIADDLETSRLSDSLVVLMSNPRQGPYGGADFERVFINYSKAMNYFALAQQASSREERLRAEDGARVEARRLLMRLDAINAARGKYQVKDDKEATFAQIFNIFSQLLVGNLVDLDSLKYRDDAMAHYLTGISFEQMGEFDDARISYQNAALAYERGYAKQYALGNDMTEQAWFDTLRMMRKAGGYEDEWPDLAKQKLSQERRQQLRTLSPDQAQLVVIEHKGTMPKRQEMNLVLTLNQDLHAFQMHPLFELGNEDGLAWFYLLYADKGIAGLLSSFMVAKHYGLMTYGFTKTIPLGPLWHEAARIGLLDAMDPALRVAVPYYRAVHPLQLSQLSIDTQTLPLMKAANPALMAVQEQMVNASRDINQAFARAALKAVLAQQVGQVGGQYGGLLAMAAKVAFQFTEAAETRNWLLLPQEIQIRRIALAPGDHQLELSSPLNNALTKQHKLSLHLAPNELYLWQVHSL